MKIYFKAEKVNNKTFYGYNIYMDEQLVDSLYGVMIESKEDTLNKATKNMLIKNESVLKFDKILTLKYENLDDTKYMTYVIHHDNFYDKYNKNTTIMTSPSVFLSDTIAKHKLEIGLDRYKLMYNYYAKSSYQR